MIEFAVDGVDVVAGKAINVTVCCHATLHPDYVRVRSYDDTGDGTSVAAHVGQVIRETIASGLRAVYADGSHHGIWLDAEYEWEASYAEDPDHWVARGGGQVPT